jgi:hypothetical protein
MTTRKSRWYCTVLQTFLGLVSLFCLSKSRAWFSPVE